MGHRETVKERARAAMSDVAREGGVITYQQLVDRIGAYNPRSPNFHELITEIARDEHAAGVECSARSSSERTHAVRATNFSSSPKPNSGSTWGTGRRFGRTS